MASMKKFTEKAVVNQLRHIERTVKNPSNADIQKSREKYNYTLSPDRNMTSYDYFKERKSELYCYKREDVKVMAGWVVTLPKEIDAEKEEDFFRCVYQFLSNRYGEENCIEAIVHKDETGQPHLHFYFIPVTEDKKHGGEKICANDVLNKKELRNFHPDLQKHLKENNLNVKVHTGITREQGGNRSVKEMKEERTHKQERQIERGRW